ncbi:hypothetical protein OPU71_00535 [Niveibacterium sp. 24ML]|uniref:hypothetical protein n=1 Tax=Niveibacterium sp. 24ML TaxID=2985512 RepID=UPI00226F61FD|nr:hypothetical protein [Niveibacterium sp. 24ML]MCX9154605.1 hypothetical protein [Niveibacterium sp. 24ML]
MTEKFVKVPYYIEKDGTKTFFLPEVRLTKGYQIGAKGEEVYYADYWEALSKLMQMNTRRFRRRNGNNIPGIVSCQPEHIEEVKQSYIEQQLSSMGVHA